MGNSEKRTCVLVHCKALPWLKLLVASFPLRWLRLEPRSYHVGFVVDKGAQGHIFSEYFYFPCQFSFHRLLHIHQLSSKDGTIGQLVADVPRGLSPIASQETKKKTTELVYCRDEDHIQPEENIYGNVIFILSFCFCSRHEESYRS
jgi:hypothetical protein